MTLIDIECPSCRGVGTFRDPSTKKIDSCPRCDGSTTIQIEAERLTHHCWQCDGTGLRNGGPKLCPICRGDGYDRPGAPTGPGHAHSVLGGVQVHGSDSIVVHVSKQATVSSSDKQASGVDIGVPTGSFSIGGHSPTVEASGGARERLTKKEMLANARSAAAITIALQEVLDQERSNSDAAHDAIGLLKRQHVVINRIIQSLEVEEGEESARSNARDLLDDLVKSLLRNWASDGPVRGTLAVATISLASILGVNLHWTAQLLVAGSFAGKEIVEALEGWVRKDC